MLNRNPERRNSLCGYRWVAMESPPRARSSLPFEFASLPLFELRLPFQRKKFQHTIWNQVILPFADEQGGRAAMVDRTELLEAALDSFAEGVALADREGHVSLWNCAAEAITGYGSREVTGQSVRAMLDAMVVGGAQR